MCWPTLRTTLYRAAAALVVPVLLFVSVAPADGAPGKKVADKIRTLRDQVQEASEDEAALLGELDDVSEARAALDAQVAQAEKQIAGTQGELDSATARLDRLSAELTSTQTRVAAARSELAAAQALLRRRAVAAYMNQGSGRVGGSAPGSSQRDIAAAYSYAQALVSAQETAVEQKNLLRDELVALEADIDERRAQALDQQQVVAQFQAGLVQQKLEHEARRNQVKAQENRYASLVDQARQRQAEFEQQIAQLQTESESIGTLLRGVQGEGAGASPGSGTLGLPVAARVTSRFGPRVHPIFGDVRVHRGIDFGAGAGTPIRAAAAGVVVHAGARGGYGNTVIVDHGGGLATLYAHQSTVVVRSGDRVGRGDVVGQVGSTGFSTGPHLHFETRVHGTPVDPAPYL